MQVRVALGPCCASDMPAVVPQLPGHFGCQEARPKAEQALIGCILCCLVHMIVHRQQSVCSMRCVLSVGTRHTGPQFAQRDSARQADRVHTLLRVKSMCCP